MREYDFLFFDSGNMLTLHKEYEKEADTGEY